MRTKKTLQRLALGAAALMASLALAACGDDDGIEGGSDAADVPTAPAGPVEGELTVSNWPLYIDKGEENTIAEFEAETGVTVKYIEDINDNVEFFGKMRPILEQGESGGRSLFVVTDWMAKRMYDLGYLQNLDFSAVPNVEENLLPSLESPSFDPEREFSVPWQSGATGIIVRKDLAPDVTSINDLLDPKYKGKVTFLTEMRDTVPMTMKALGINDNPEDAPKEDWLEAIDVLAEATDSGQIRDWTGNDYGGGLARGDIVAAVGWSGDTVQLQADNANIVWLNPDEGCSLWSDNMVIPVGAPNTGAAYGFMDFVYQPEVQANIAEFVNYYPPVSGVKEILAERDPDLANNPLIFPEEADQEGCFTQPTLTGEDEAEVEEAFQQVITG